MLSFEGVHLSAVYAGLCVGILYHYIYLYIFINNHPTFSLKMQLFPLSNAKSKE